MGSGSAATVAARFTPEADMPTKPTKIETILKLLRRPNGASIAQLQQAAGWQPHSIRSALTGFRKKGVAVTRDKNAAGVSVYRAAAG